MASTLNKKQTMVIVGCVAAVVIFGTVISHSGKSTARDTPALVNPPILETRVPVALAPPAQSTPDFDPYAGERQPATAQTYTPPQNYVPTQGYAPSQGYQQQAQQTGIYNQQFANDQLVRRYYGRAAEIYRQAERQQRQWGTSQPGATNALRQCVDGIRSAGPNAFPSREYQGQYIGMAQQIINMAQQLQNKNLDGLYGAGASDPNNPLNSVNR